MSNPQKDKGDKAELEVQGILQDLLGQPGPQPIRRKLGAGRLDDQGDIDGVPDCTIQVANYSDFGRAVREKLAGCVDQQARAGDTFGCSFIRRRGGSYVVVMTPEQWAVLYREATS